ncbi:MAG TPA: sensor histidine kinase [Candidatus Sulfotelmatobacter sp.]|nr:sensor histidine kinase [Candidatus Sulfotelmatobacter sp.]
MFTKGVFGIARRDLGTVALYDVLPSLAVAAVMTVDIFQWSGSEQPTNAQRLSYLAVSVLALTGLLLRRRAPLFVLIALVVVYKAWAYLFFPPGVQIPFSPVLIVPILAYNAGAHTRGWRTLAGVAVLVLFFGPWIWNVLRGQQTGNELTFGAVLTVAWLIGKGMQRYRNLTTSLRAQARQLEQERDERARLAVALERARIARELHDVIAHSVSVMVVQAAAERKVLGQEQHETRDVLEMIERTGRQALVELRRMLGVLRRTDDTLLLAPQPRLSDLDSLIEQVREAGLPVAFHVEGSRVPVPAGVELSAYRIVQETLTNTLKHGGRAHAEVTLRYLGDHLELVVVDDGRGSAEGMRPNDGHGLVGMRERVSMLGGSLHAGPRESGGFLVTATLPLESA